MSLTLRRLTVDDELETFGRIVLSSYRALPGHPPDPDYDAELADVTARVREGMVFGAFLEAVPVGCVTYVNDPSSPHAERLGHDEASFRMLAVSKDAQGRGVGEALVSRCLHQARTAGRSAMFIYSGDWMTTAHRLYDRLGFIRTPERDWQFADLDITLLGFRREL